MYVSAMETTTKRKATCGVKQLLSLQDNLFSALLRPNLALHRTSCHQAKLSLSLKSADASNLRVRYLFSHCNKLA